MMKVGQQLNILVVDDEWLDREGLCGQIMTLTRREIAVSMAKNATDALNHFGDSAFDILFTDIRMPGLSGLELAGKVRESYPKTEIIFVSGYDDFEYARQAITVEAVYYLLKPVVDSELTKALGMAISRIDDRIPAQPPKMNSLNSFLQTDMGIARRIFEKVDGMLRNRLSDDVTLKDIAEELHYTPNHMGKLFAEGGGMRFGDYLISLRMEQAAALLRSNPELRISQVAEAVGYKDPNAFTRQFHAAFGILPKTGRSRE